MTAGSVTGGGDWWATPAPPLEADGRGWSAAPAAVATFHDSIPGHAPTTLHDVPDLADELGVARVVVKEESARLGLPAFKVLGVSWAVARTLVAHATGADADGSSTPQDPTGGGPALTWDRLTDVAAGLDGVTLASATDGNHGRALARVAARLGLQARIHVPAVMAVATAAAIADEGAEVVRVHGTYDQAVAIAADQAAVDPDVLLVQDTAWPGYEVVPAWVVEGYSTIFREVDDQLDARPPTLTVVPVGVGSFAQAAVVHARSAGDRAHRAVLGVEPDTAACVVASLAADAVTTVPTGDTTMAGLNCGSPSSLAWPVLRSGLDAAVAVPDDAATRAVGDLAAHGIDSGPSGAAALAGARRALTGPGATDRRRRLGVTSHAVVVLVSTEGRAEGAP